VNKRGRIEIENEKTGINPPNCRSVAQKLVYDVCNLSKQKDDFAY